MRLMSRAALVFAATLFAAPAYAQTSVSLAAGATLPIGSTADRMEMGYNAILGVGIKPPLAPIGVRIEGMFSSMAYKTSAFPSGSKRTMAGIANVTLSGPAVPMGYVIGGVGMYNGKDVGLPTGAPSTSATDFGFNIGAGLNLPLTGFGAFLEARLHVINTETKSTKIVPITFGIKF